MLVVITIISLVSSLFGTSIYKLVKEYRFEQSCGSIATELYASGRVAHVQDGVIEVHLEIGNKGLLFRRTTDEAIPVDAYFFTYSKQFKEVLSFEVDGVKKTKCTLRFTPNGIREKVITLKHGEKFHKIPLHLL